MAFRNLFVKEIKSILPVYAVFAAMVFVLDLIIWYKSSAVDNEVIFVTTLLVPFLSAAAIAVGTSYYQLHVEWRTNSIYLLLSLPVRGWKVLTSKLLAVLSLLALTVLWIGVSFAVLLLRITFAEWKSFEDLPLSAATLCNITLFGFLIYVLAVLFFVAVTHFTYLCGQLVAKYRWIVMTCAFFGMMWLILRISPVLSELLRWTPEIFFGGKDLDVVYLHSGPFIVLLLLSAGLVGLNGLIFEKELEV